MEQPDDHTPQDQPSAPKPEAESEHADARAGALADLFTSSILDSMPQLDSSRPTNESDSVRSSQACAESGTAAGFEFDPATMEMVAAKRNILRNAAETAAPRPALAPGPTPTIRRCLLRSPWLRSSSCRPGSIRLPIG